MSEPKELWEVARDAVQYGHSDNWWKKLTDAVIAEHERRKADPYAHLKAAAADPTKQVKVKTWIDWVNGGMSYQWSWHLPPEDYEIRDKPKKVDWSQLSPHVRKYLREYEEQRFQSIWIPWGLPEFGDKCPVPEGVMVEYRLGYDHFTQKATEGTDLNWSCELRSGQITAFRITGVNDQWEA